MRTLFRSQELWELVENGIAKTSVDETGMRESMNKDEKALDFESAVMKGNETVQKYLARISNIVSQMRAYGDKVADEIVVVKILRSLSPKFDHVVAAIEESKDLSTYSVDELMGSLQTHEARINRNMAKEDEHAFQVQGEHARKDKKAQYAEQEEDEYLFMTYVSLVSKGVWYLDSACSNHMTGNKEK
nr:DUF4219 domain-containing protein/UBN2 domain-containing protein [Tanacetum cinerariifolium]